MDMADEVLLAEGEHRGVTKGRVEGRAEGRAEGEVNGRSKMFLRAAERLFQIVPDHRAEQVRNASEEQVNEWFDRLFDASDLDSVFDGSEGNGTAINGVPVR